MKNTKLNKFQFFHLFFFLFPFWRVLNFYHRSWELVGAWVNIYNIKFCSEGFLVFHCTSFFNKMTWKLQTLLKRLKTLLKRIWIYMYSRLPLGETHWITDFSLYMWLFLFKETCIFHLLMDLTHGNNKYSLQFLTLTFLFNSIN